MASPMDRPICGFTPGRRHRNQAFQDELSRKLEERGGPIDKGNSHTPAMKKKQHYLKMKLEIHSRLIFIVIVIPCQSESA